MKARHLKMEFHGYNGCRVAQENFGQVEWANLMQCGLLEVLVRVGDVLDVH